MTTESQAEPRIPTVGPRERFTAETLLKLDAPLNQARVASDPRGNPYLEGWDVIAAANAYFGFDGWSSEVLSVGIAYSTLREVGHGDRRREVEISVYQSRVAIEAGGVRKVDIGSSISADDSPQSHETAAKGAVTDGLKRALRQFGAQFGNDLYDRGRTGNLNESSSEPIPRPPVIEKPTDVLTWAWTTHRMNKTKVFEACGVSTIEGLAQLGGEGQTRIENYVESQR